MAGIDLSVVIPTYNRKSLLRDMLAALAGQTLSPDRFEVIVVVDGSTDGTLDMVSRVRVPYRLRVVAQAQSGVAAARNRGARKASGDVLLFLDDDLLPSPDLLEQHMRTQTQNASGVVLGRLVPNQEGRQKGWKVWEDRVMVKHYQAMSAGARPPTGRRLYSGNFSVPRRVFLEAGGFDESFRRGEDVELGMRLEGSGVPFYFNGDASAVHRGTRGFASWCGSAYAYGRCEVVLAKAAPGPRPMAEVFERFFHRPLPLRCIVAVTLGRTIARKTMVQSLRAICGVMSAMRMYGPAHAGYSTIFNLQYWGGVADEVGGREAFMRYAGGVRKPRQPERAQEAWETRR